MKIVCSLLALPLMAQESVNIYTAEKERALGRQVASEIRRQSEPLANAAVDAYVKRIGSTLTGHLEDDGFEYQFEVISANDRTEPIPLPGGYILIPVRSFVAAHDEAEFVGMVAHTIGHVALRHGTRTASRGQTLHMASIPIVFLGGWSGSHADLQHPQARLLPISFLDFQRTYELEADRFGLELAARAGYDAAGFQRYVERTHPPDSKMSPLPPREMRLTKLQEILPSLRSAMAPSSDEEFRRVQEAVRAMVEQPKQRRPPTLKR